MRPAFSWATLTDWFAHRLRARKPAMMPMAIPPASAPMAMPRFSIFVLPSGLGRSDALSFDQGSMRFGVPGLAPHRPDRTPLRSARGPSPRSLLRGVVAGPRVPGPAAGGLLRGAHDRREPVAGGAWQTPGYPPSEQNDG